MSRKEWGDVSLLIVRGLAGVVLFSGLPGGAYATLADFAVLSTTGDIIGNRNNFDVNSGSGAGHVGAGVRIHLGGSGDVAGSLIAGQSNPANNGITVGNNATIHGACVTAGGTIVLGGGTTCVGGQDTDGVNLLLTDLVSAITEALGLNAELTALTSTQTLGVLNTANNVTTNLNLVAGLNVIDYTSMSLGAGNTVQINSTGATDTAVVRIAGALTTGNNMNIVLTGGITEDRVIFQLGGNIALGGSGQYRANFLALSGSCTQGNGNTIFGNLICSGNIDPGGSTIFQNLAFDGDLVVIPEPGTYIMLATGLAAIGLYGRRSRRS